MFMEYFGCDEVIVQYIIDKYKYIFIGFEFYGKEGYVELEREIVILVENLFNIWNFFYFGKISCSNVECLVEL